MDLTYSEPCSCGKRFIDEVFAHMYVIMREEGVLGEDDPLAAVGSPLVHPGFAMNTRDHKIRNQQTRRLNNSPEGVTANHVDGHCLHEHPHAE